jgi:hypothetical protein
MVMTIEGLRAARAAINAQLDVMERELERRADRILRLLIKCGDLVQKIPRFDKMRWDSGQWLCAIEFGPGWNDDPEFNRLYHMHMGDWPDEEFEKYGRLHEWLEAEASSCKKETP